MENKSTSNAIIKQYKDDFPVYTVSTGHCAFAATIAYPRRSPHSESNMACLPPPGAMPRNLEKKTFLKLIHF